jgi:hypothetical protein
VTNPQSAQIVLAAAAAARAFGPDVRKVVRRVRLGDESNAQDLWIGAGRDAEGVPSRMIRKVSE